MSKSIRVGYQYPASRLRLIRKRWAVIVSIPAHLRHLYSNQRDKRKSTFTSDKNVADRLHHALAQQIYDEFDQKQNEHLTKHHAVTDNFAADTIYGLATSFKYKNIPDLKPSTEYSQLVALKNSCDVYADIIINGGAIDEAKVMADFIATSPSPEEVLVRFRELQINSPYTTEQKGLAGRYEHLIPNLLA